MAALFALPGLEDVLIRVPCETYLWLSLALGAVYAYPTKRSLVIALANLVTRCVVPAITAPPAATSAAAPRQLLKSSSFSLRCRTPEFWRRTGERRGVGGDDNPRRSDLLQQGMSLVLLPVLLEAMDHQRAAAGRLTAPPDDAGADHHHHVYFYYGRYALALAASSVATEFNLPAVALLAAVGDPERQLRDWRVPVFLAAWYGLSRTVHWAEALRGVWTRGEWMLTTALLALALTEAAAGLADKTWDADHLHQYVALAGIVSCLVACAVEAWVYDFLETWRYRKLEQLMSLPVRLLMIVLMSLAGVEIFLAANASAARLVPDFPRSLNWILEFLLNAEIAPLHVGDLPIWRRLTWVVYWGVVLLVAIPLAPHNSPVIARKWFHALAIVLFAPVALACPALMSLGYAVALAALAVAECVRRDIPSLNAFYERYLDEGKDGRADGIVVSHMCFLFGCAAPLWVADALDLREAQAETMGLLSLWGILCLGVGDSMGAIVGRKLGSIEWGRSRTVEGSLAMLTSMLALYFILAIYLDVFGAEQGLYWVPAIFFVTALEAFTHEIDNLVLPLAGVAVILMSRHILGRGHDLPVVLS